MWSILITRFWFGERVAAVRLGCVILGLMGLVLMLSGNGGWPIPRNPFDWMALASGFFWAVIAIRVAIAQSWRHS